MLLSISRLCFFVALFAPVLFVPQLFFPFVTGKVLFFRTMVEAAVFFFLLFLIFAAREERRNILSGLMEKLRHPLTIALSIFTAAFFLTALTGINFSYSFWSNFERGDGVFQMLHYLLFFGLALALFRTKKDWMWVFKITLAASILVSLYALMQLAGSPLVFRQISQVGGTLGSPSYLAIYLLFHFVFALIVLRASRTKFERNIWLAILLFEAVIFLNTQVRGAFIGLATGMAAALFFLAVRGSSLIQKRWARIALAVFVIGIAAFWITRSSDIWKPIPGLKRFYHADLLYPLRDRLWTWGSALEAFRERPFLGWGAENFPVAFDTYYNPNNYGIQSWFDRAHNIVLDTATTGGLVLLIAYIAIWVVYARELLRVSAEAWMKSLLWGLPVAYIVQNLVLFDVLSTYIPLYLLLAYVVFLVTAQEGKTDEHMIRLLPQRNSARLGVACVLAISAGSILFVGTVLPLKKNLLIIKGMKPSIEHLEQWPRTMERAVGLYSPVGQAELVEQFSLRAQQILAAVRDGEITMNESVLRDMLNTVNRIYDDAKRNGDIIGVKANYFLGTANLIAAQMLNDISYFTFAKTLFTDAIARAPHRPEIIYPVIDIAIAERDTKRAEEFLKLIKELRPDLEQTNLFENKLRAIQY